jgi:hemolysin activation/secretion protein
VPVGSGSEKFDLQRFNALRQYFYAKADANRTQPLPLGLVAYGKVQGQITDDPLLSSEQFSAGGANSVRGYLEAERLGDRGVMGTIELRTPSAGQQISSLINDWHYLAFLDGAALWLRQPLPGERSSFSLLGAGVGTRFTAFDRLNGALDVAFALVEGSTTKIGKARIHFRLWSGF